MWLRTRLTLWVSVGHTSKVTIRRISTPGLALPGKNDLDGDVSSPVEDPRRQHSGPVFGKCPERARAVHHTNVRSESPSASRHDGKRAAEAFEAHGRRGCPAGRGFGAGAAGTQH